MKQYGLFSADILLPKDNFEKFSVIACDQYTSEAEYWENVKELVGNTPSALNIILPEIYLEDNMEKRVENINKTMQEYLENGVFNEFSDAMIYLERTTIDGYCRKGLVGVIDLEDYDYVSGTTAKIRATEQTVLERIPPRVKIRKDAVLELPHIMLMIDDPDFKVIEPLSEQKNEFEKAYDFDLMRKSGKVSGFLLNERAKENVWKALKALTENANDEFLFAVGDGNHSLATAKECYRQNPTEKSRYALVEVVNIHDESIEFEPIYRVLFNAEPQKIIEKLQNMSPKGDDNHKFTCIYDGKEQDIKLGRLAKLPVGTLQKLLDEILEENSNIKIDYIHGIESTKEICKQNNTLGFIFDGMKKQELFDAIRQDGSLPRKTFSMGHADDKRFYIEARKIK